MKTIEERVIDKIWHRRELGLKKYGVGLERTDLSRLDWLRHAQEEMLDASEYLEKLIELEEVRQNILSPPGNHKDFEGNVTTRVTINGVALDEFWAKEKLRGHSDK